MRKQLNTFLISLLALLVTACEQGVEFSPSPTDNFEALWRELDQKYCFFPYKAEQYGLDWDEVHDRYAPLVHDDMTNRELFDVLSLMVGELRDGHTNLIGPYYTSSYSDFYARYPNNFDGGLVASMLGRIYYSGDVTYGFLLPDSIGYVHVASFASGVSSSLVSELFRYFRSSPGLIIDMRSNGGGDLDGEQNFVARFMSSSEKLHVGYIAHKTGPAHDAFSKPVPVYIEPDTTLTTWTRPVCVLAGRRTFSAANDFVRNMKLLPQVTVLGDRTGGGSGLPMSTELPNGWSLRYSSSPLYDVNMQHTEFGIDPDIPVALAEEDRQKSIDTIIQTAINIINEEK